MFYIVEHGFGGWNSGKFKYYNRKAKAFEWALHLDNEPYRTTKGAMRVLFQMEKNGTIKFPVLGSEGEVHQRRYSIVSAENLNKARASRRQAELAVG
jgi:hypothetical protein